MAIRDRKNKQRVTLPERFVPQFWDEADGRCALVKEIRRRYESLKVDTGTESYQKELICQRAIFITVQLETMERIAAETGRFNAGIYTQMVNTLIGLLKSLGLERKAKKVTLRSYVEGKK
jgi:hypothetical protein